MASSIDHLVLELEATHGLWVNGVVPTDLDEPASDQAIDFLKVIFAHQKIDNFTIEEGPVVRHISDEDYTIFRCTIEGEQAFVLLNQTNKWFQIRR